MKLLVDVLEEFAHEVSEQEEHLTPLILQYNQKITKDIAYFMLLNQLGEYLGQKVVKK